MVLFGAGKIPQIMKDLGSGVRAFKRGFDSECGEIDLETEINKYGKSKSHRPKVAPKKRAIKTANKGDKTTRKSASGNKLKANNISKQAHGEKKNGKANKKNNSN